MSLSQLRLYYQGSKRKGYFEQAKQMVYDFYYNRKFSRHPFQFSTGKIFDEFSTKPVIDINSRNKDNFRNQPTPYYDIFTALKFVAHKNQTINLLDIGCGDGRVLVAGISLKFNSVIGIDIDEQAIDSAKKNCQLAQRVFHPATTYQVLSKDAADFIIPEEANLIFLFNPFGEETLKSVIDNLYKNYLASPRTIYIAYCNPLFSSTFEQNIAFIKTYERKLKNGTNDLLIYKLLADKIIFETHNSK